MNKLFKWYLRWRDVADEGRKVTPDSATEASAVNVADRNMRSTVLKYTDVVPNTYFLLEYK